MTVNVEALRHYLQFLGEREGRRHVKLTRAAREGLKKLVAGVPASPSLPLAARDIPANVVTAVPGDDAVRPARASALRRAATLEVEPRGSAATTFPTIEVAGSTKVEQLAHLAARASVCVKCPHLAARRHNVVFGVGDPDARLLFIGEGPGEEEDLQGEPFVGRAGQLLTKMILAMGLTREQVYIANVLKCRPDMPPGAPGNRKPTVQEMETCVPYLRAQVEIIKPAALVALGATAVEGLLGPVGSIGSLRGKFLEFRGAPLMPTYHPSYLLRNQSNTEKRKVWEDLLLVMERLEMPISDKQRNFFLRA